MKPCWQRQRDVPGWLMLRKTGDAALGCPGKKKSSCTFFAEQERGSEVVVSYNNEQ